MNIIQSFWSKPSLHDNQDYENSRKFGGWFNFKYFLISSSFSCLTIKKYHKRISLFTDSKGYDILINKLKLPYDNVSLVLDRLDNEDHRLWILGKVTAIKLQQSPFLHIDNDIFLWKKLQTLSVPRGLVAQSTSPIWSEYKSSLYEIFANFSYIPDCLKEKPTSRTMVANVGVIGGNDLDFFQQFCQISSDLLEKNRSLIPLINVGGFNQMMEEYLFTCLARDKGSKIQYILDSSVGKFPQSHLHFNLVPIVYKYIHLIGFYKQNFYACDQIALRLKYEFPKYYKILFELIESSYPQLVIKKSTNVTRETKRLAIIDIFYKKSIEQIMKMKIRISSDIEIIKAKDFDTEEFQYFVKQTGPDSKDTTYQYLPTFFSKNTYKFLFYFSVPKSIIEVLEQIKSETASGGNNGFEDMEFHLVDSVTKHLILTGILEFT